MNFEQQFPREAEVLMALRGRLRIHVFSDGAICEHGPRQSNPLLRKTCPVCGNPKP
jgi:hypothetical protein